MTTSRPSRSVRRRRRSPLPVVMLGAASLGACGGGQSATWREHRPVAPDFSIEVPGEPTPIDLTPTQQAQSGESTQVTMVEFDGDIVALTETVLAPGEIVDVERAVDGAVSGSSADLEARLGTAVAVDLVEFDASSFGGHPARTYEVDLVAGGDVVATMSGRVVASDTTLHQIQVLDVGANSPALAGRVLDSMVPLG